MTTYLSPDEVRREYGLNLSIAQCCTLMAERVTADHIDDHGEYHKGSRLGDLRLVFDAGLPVELRFFTELSRQLPKPRAFNYEPTAHLFYVFWGAFNAMTTPPSPVSADPIIAVHITHNGDKDIYTSFPARVVWIDENCEGERVYISRQKAEAERILDLIAVPQED